ncbi:MAG: trigger factor [Flavobacteriales bacterium]
MNLTLEHIDELNALLKVDVKSEDYKEAVEKQLKTVAKQANIPGFRAGKVPKSVIQKRFGASVKAEKVNELVSEQIGSYLSENKVNYLAGPLPKMPSDDWIVNDEFTFEYELGLSPEFKLSMSKRNKLAYYNIKAGEDQIDKYAKDMANRYGKMEAPEAVKEGDSVTGVWQQCDKKGELIEGGLEVEANLDTNKVADKKAKKELIDSGIDTRLVLDMNTLFEDVADAQAFLKIDEVTWENLDSKHFSCTIDHISRLTPADFNEELFEKLYPEGDIKTEADFRARIKTEAEAAYVADADQYFFNTAVDYILEKADIELPETFLKKWIKANNKEELTEEQIEQDFDKEKVAIQWQIIEAKIAQDNDIKIEMNEVEDQARLYVRQQMMQYGQGNIEDEMLNGIVKNVLDNDQERERISKQVFHTKLTTFFKETFKLDEKDVTVDEFIELVNPKK